MSVTVGALLDVGASVAKGPNQGLPDAGERLPVVAFPTVALFCATLALWLLSLWCAVHQAASWGVIVGLNTVTSFVMFTVLHDASHHAIGRSDWINELFGRLSMFFVLAYASFPLFRFIHIEHHRNANEGVRTDPDAWASYGPVWTHPFRWLTIDAWYATIWIWHARHRPLAEVVESGVLFFATLAGLVWASFAGVLAEVLLFLFLPQRIALTLLAWWFDWLPHHGLTETARQNRFQATRNRVGSEWLFTPLMLYQNYHLVHHLHPSIPFYRYIAAWRRNEESYLERNPALSGWWGRRITIDGYRALRGLASPPAHREDTAGSGATARARFHSLQIREMARLTPDSMAITFAVPESLRETFVFRQGQHLTIRCDLGGVGVRRNYSICSPVSSGRLRIAVKHIPGGAFSTHALEKLRPGDTLDVMAPSGRFFTQLDAAQAKVYGAIAAGSGITPILSILTTTLEVEQESKCILLFGNQTVDSIMFRDEIQALKERYPERFQVLHFLSRAPADAENLNGSLERELFHGRLDRELCAGRLDRKKLAKLFSTFARPDEVHEWFLCGPPELIAEARLSLLYHGVDEAHVHQEVFIAPATRMPGAETRPADGAAMTAVTVRAGGRATDFELARGGETVLDAAMRLRADLPYSCLGGACGTCRARLCTGTVEMEQNFALDAQELAAGYVLTCQSRPTSERVELDYDA